MSLCIRKLLKHRGFTMNTLGERIVFLRELRGISQKELAARLDITAASMSRYENNVYDPKSEILTKLCEILHTNADFLLGMSCDYHMPKASMEMSAADKKLWLLYQQLSPEDKIRIEERILTLAESHSK